MIEQGTPEWFAQRCGKITASRIADVMAKTKTGWGATRKNYQAQLVAERMTNTVADSFSNSAMQWGTQTEPEAREAYEARQLVAVELSPFVSHPSMPFAGASPDGCVGKDGLIEIKCPNTATHIDALLVGKIPDKYIKQMQWQMACTGRQWCDFVSYDPRVGDKLCIWIKRVNRDQGSIDEIEQAVVNFNDEIEKQVSALLEFRSSNND